jgi:ATP-binding cassette, subfamily B, bacterial CvaB/MchF/RaxB
MSKRELRFGFGRKLPVYLQAERAECGLACLAMISTQLGCELDVADLRRKYPSSQKGSTASELIDVARGLGMTARALKLEVSEMGLLVLPAINTPSMTQHVDDLY